jgi:hypothetical protein
VRPSAARSKPYWTGAAGESEAAADRNSRVIASIRITLNPLVE